MTEEKKECLREILASEVEDGWAAGVQAAVYEKGQEIFYHAYGMADRERGIPMGRDTICRMYSMTKPVTATAAWILKEQGLLDFRDPVEKYLPEFAHMQVLRNGVLSPAERSITVTDLLGMTSGIVYPDIDAAGREMEKTFQELKASQAAGTPWDTREVLRHIAAVPLCAQPGSRWRYGLSADVLGGIIQVISGRKLSEFLKEEIFDPLEMEDTGFYVPEEKQDRFAQLYCLKEGGGCEIERERHLGLTLCLEPSAYEAGGAGLVSTIEDYSRFARMLAAGGQWEGRRILSETSVDCFRKNMLSEKLLPTIDFPHMKGYGYGNLMRVNLGLGESYSSEHPGEFGWDGWTGPYFTVDREHERVLIYMVQIAAFQHWDVIWKLRDAAFGKTE